jgi:cytochrome P450
MTLTASPHLDVPSGLAIDLSDEGLRADPYPVWRWLRDNDPVHRTAQRSWLLTRYDDCASALRDRRLGNDMRKATADVFTEDSPLFGQVTYRPSLFYEVPEGALSRPFLLTDPPVHDALRRAATPPFRPLALRTLASRVDELAASIVSSCVESDRFDVVGDVAYPLPVTMICDILGVPEEARAPIKEAAGDVGAVIDAGMVRTPEQRERTRAGLMNAIGAMVFLIAARQTEPGDDLISHLLAQGLAPEDVVSTATLVLVAGHETTVNLIANATLALLNHPGELARLATHPDDMDNAIEEFLRYDAPVQLIARVALEPFEIRGKHIEAGDQLIVCIGAANRDPDVFPDPDRLTVDRSEAKHHLGFGSGTHYCLGASLARMEAAAVLRHLVPHLDSFVISEPPHWRPVSSLRSLAALHLERSSA